MTSPVHSFFDKVFVLSLPHASKRREHTVKLMAEAGITFEFFDALDGNSMLFDAEWSFYDNRPLVGALEKIKRNKLIGSRGAWACQKSYIALMKLVLDSGYERVLIFEDDVLLAKSFDRAFEKFMSIVPHDWRLLMLGASQANWNTTEIQQGYYHPLPLITYGAFAVGYHRQALPAILYGAQKMESPFDKGALSEAFGSYPNKCFVAYPNLVIADVNSSDIRQERNMTDHSQKMHWDLALYNLTQ